MKNTSLNVNFGKNINEISFEKHFSAYLLGEKIPAQTRIR